MQMNIDTSIHIFWVEKKIIQSKLLKEPYIPDQNSSFVFEGSKINESLKHVYVYVHLHKVDFYFYYYNEVVKLSLISLGRKRQTKFCKIVFVKLNTYDCQ